MMEEKMGLTEAKHDDSENKEIEAFLEMKKFYDKKRQISEPKSSAFYNKCSKEFKTLFNHKPPTILMNRNVFELQQVLFGRKSPIEI